MIEKLLLANDNRNRKTIYLLFVICYFILNIFLIANHESWRDEAQAWVIAKNLSIIDMFKILCTEGHPCLWFLFLMPFAKLGLSFEYISYVSLLIMCIAVYVFLESAPFSLLVKIGILFSSMFLYYNPVVSRVYSLIALLVVLLGKFYKQRSEKPILYGILIALLFQTHILVFGLAIGLTIDLLIKFFNDKKNKKLLMSLLIILFSVICMIMEIMPRSSKASGIDTSMSGLLDKLSISNILSGMQYFAYTGWGWMNKDTYFIPYICFGLCVLFIIIFICLNKTWKQNYQTIITAICGCGIFFGIVWLVYKPHTQMSSILIMILLFVMWILYENNEQVNIRLSIIVLLALVSFLTFSVCQSVLRQDIAGYYSTSKKTSEYIENNIKKDDVIVLENCVYDTTIYAYVSSYNKDIKFYDLRNRCDYIFYQAGSDIINDKLSLDYIVDTSLNDLKEKENIYYLSNSLIDDNRLQLVYSNENIKTVSGENYFIYIIKE